MELREESYKIARKIWSSTDVILLIFAGSAAEFAAIKAVDWLFYTNKLPSAPIDRLFDTARFAQGLFFSPPEKASETLRMINRIHSSVETSRERNIPNWAYKDVLYMLIDYSERAYKIVFGEMSLEEKKAYFDGAKAVGEAMNLYELPLNYEDYLVERQRQLLSDYEMSEFTVELFKSYSNSLGKIRFEMLKLVQASLIPEELMKVLHFKSNPVISFLLNSYRYLPGGGEKLAFLHSILLPKKHTKQLRELGKVNEFSLNYT